MLNHNGYAAYANSKIMTASPAELTLMLYDGAIKFCNMAIAGIEENNIEKAHNNIRKVEDIISEFQATLNHKYATADDFNNVYVYLKERLIEANMKKDKEILEEVLKHLRTMRDTWSDETGCQPEITGRRKQYIVTDNYIGIMIESLRRKKDVLTDILKLSEEQSLLLDDPNLEPDTFEKNVNRKAALIEKLEQLDTGFESLYDKVKEELESNRDIHKEQIRQMQELIRALTELNMQIQATEARNKEKATAKFAYIRQQAKEIRSSQKIVKEYYNNMMHKAYNEPHFLDNKK